MAMLPSLCSTKNAVSKPQISELGTSCALSLKYNKIICFYNVEGLSETTCLPTQGKGKVCVHSTLPVPDHTCRITLWVRCCLFVVVSFFIPVHFVYRKVKDMMNKMLD